MKAYVTIGLPASGKSSWAKEFMNQEAKMGKEIVRVNNDEIRNIIYDRLGNRNWSKKIEAQVKEARENIIRFNAENIGRDIIVDNTHMSPYALKEIKEFCQGLGYEVEEVDFRHVPIEECIRRDSLREGNEKVGEAVIRKMAKYMSKPVHDMPEWKPNGLPNCIIVDIDGTLSNNQSGRSFYDESRVYDDTPRQQVVSTIKAIQERDGDDFTFIFSGRTDACREETTRWLEDKCGFFVNNNNNIETQLPECNQFHEVFLAMRNSGDTRNDAIVKMELYEKYIKDKFNVMAVFDDRADVIRNCWDKLGLFVFRCGRIDQDEF